MDFGSLHLDHLQFFESILFDQLGREVQVKDYVFLAGGCINQAVQVISSQGDFFVKWNEKTDDELFACEAKGLELLRQTNNLAVPEVIGYGQKAQRAYLVLEYLPFSQPKTDYWEHLGQTLAQTHRYTGEAFGLSFNNFIGSLEQNNEWMAQSTDFFIERRLKPQAGLALYHQALPQHLYKKFQNLYDKLPEILPAEKPALLHGDLWHGNVLVGRDGHACLIDPAVYYGNREAELAFTHLFGGFENRFYEAYQEAFPLEPGFQQRIEIYNLYPLLVHVNLFGSGYLPGVERVLQKF
jgi:fructosamine-3-kinase